MCFLQKMDLLKQFCSSLNQQYITILYQQCYEGKHVFSFSIQKSFLQIQSLDTFFLSQTTVLFFWNGDILVQAPKVPGEYTITEIGINLSFKTFTRYLVVNATQQKLKQKQIVSICQCNMVYNNGTDLKKLFSKKKTKKPLDYLKESM